MQGHILVKPDGRINVDSGGRILTSGITASPCCCGPSAPCNYYIRYQPCPWNGTEEGTPHYLCPEEDETRPDIYIACDFRCIEGEWLGDGYPPGLVKYRGWCYAKAYNANEPAFNEDRYCKPPASGVECSIYPPLPPDVLVFDPGDRRIECVPVPVDAQPGGQACVNAACRCYQWHQATACPCSSISVPTYCSGALVRQFSRAGLVCGAGPSSAGECVSCRSGFGGRDDLPDGALGDGGGFTSCCKCCETRELSTGNTGSFRGCRRWSYFDANGIERGCCCSVDDEIVISMSGSYFAVLSPGRTLTVTIRNGDFRLTRGVPHTVITEFRSSDGSDDSDRPQVYEFGDGAGACGLGNYRLPTAFTALVAGDRTEFFRTTCVDQQDRVTWRADPNSGQIFNGQGALTATYAGNAGGTCRSGCRAGEFRPAGSVRTGDVDPARAAATVAAIGRGCGGCGGGGL